MIALGNFTLETNDGRMILIYSKTIIIYLIFSKMIFNSLAKIMQYMFLYSYMYVYIYISYLQIYIIIQNIVYDYCDHLKINDTNRLKDKLPSIQPWIC